MQTVTITRFIPHTHSDKNANQLEYLYDLIDEDLVINITDQEYDEYTEWIIEGEELDKVTFDFWYTLARFIDPKKVTSNTTYETNSPICQQYIERALEGIAVGYDYDEKQVEDIEKWNLKKAFSITLSAPYDKFDLTITPSAYSKSYDLEVELREVIKECGGTVLAESLIPDGQYTCAAGTVIRRITTYTPQKAKKDMKVLARRYQKDVRKPDPKKPLIGNIDVAVTYY